MLPLICAAVVALGVTQARADLAADCTQTADRDKAIGACTSLLKEAGNDSGKLQTAYVGRAAAYRSKGQLPEAQSDLTRALYYNPKDASLWYQRGLVRAARGQNIRAGADFNLALRYDPKHVPSLIERGEAFRRLGALPKAISDAGEAIKLDPRSAAAYGNRAYAQLRMGKLDLAAADAAEAIKLDDKSARGHLVRGLAAEKADKAKAAADVKRALELDPELRKARELQEVIKRLGL
jgi:tetratricopeptide (TPR) repeat protein